MHSEQFQSTNHCSHLGWMSSGTNSTAVHLPTYTIATKLKGLLSSNDDLIVYADLWGLRSNIAISSWNHSIINFGYPISTRPCYLQQTLCHYGHLRTYMSSWFRSSSWVSLWSETEYIQILAGLDRLNVSHCYSTIEIGVLGNFQPHSIKTVKDVSSFVSDQALSTATVRSFLIDMARASICASERIFLGRNCKEWTVNPD